MKPGVLIAFLTLLLSGGAAIVNVSVRAGTLETRVDQLEKSVLEMSGDVKHLLDATARIETHLELIRSRIDNADRCKAAAKP